MKKSEEKWVHGPWFRAPLSHTPLFNIYVRSTQTPSNYITTLKYCYIIHYYIPILLYHYMTIYYLNILLKCNIPGCVSEGIPPYCTAAPPGSTPLEPTASVAKFGLRRLGGEARQQRGGSVPQRSGSGQAGSIARVYSRYRWGREPVGGTAALNY